MFKKFFGKSESSETNKDRSQNTESGSAGLSRLQNQLDELNADFRLRCRDYDTKCAAAREAANAFKALQSSGATAGRIQIEEQQLNMILDEARSAFRRVSVVQEKIGQQRNLLDASEYKQDLQSDFRPQLFLEIEADIERLRDQRDDVRDASNDLKSSLAAEDTLSADELTLPATDRRERDLDEEIERL